MSTQRQHKEGEAMSALAKAYALISQALIAGKDPDFSLFDEVKRLAEEAKELDHTVTCVNCKAVLHAALDPHTTILISAARSLIKGSEQSWTINQENRELILCDKCDLNVLEFINQTPSEGAQSGQDKDENEDKE